MEDTTQRDALASTSEHSTWGAGKWLNPPGAFRARVDGSLEVVTDGQTDFWRETHYGFIRDNGHFLALTPPLKRDLHDLR